MVSNSSGIYIITNKQTNKLYIGSCVNFRKRYSKHFTELRKNKHGNPHLQNAFNLYGEEAFEFHIIEECEKEDLINLEQKYLDKHNECELYNIRKIAHSNLGLRASLETKQKMSIAGKNKEFTTEHKANISKAKKGFAPMKGRRFTEEHIKKIKEASYKKVYCIELDKSFNSIVEAAKEFGVSSGAIIQSIKKGTRVCRQYTFKYGVSL